MYVQQNPGYNNVVYNQKELKACVKVVIRNVNDPGIHNNKAAMVAVKRNGRQVNVR